MVMVTVMEMVWVWPVCDDAMDLREVRCVRCEQWP